MREIKFRAWHKEHKLMFLPEALWFNNPQRQIWINNSHEFRKEYENKLYGYVDEKIILMQYTGLKDKNGKEIYEGDMIKLCNNPNGYLQVVFLNAYVGGWVLKYNDEYGIVSLGAREQNEIEIIGNVYENPELLTKEGVL